MATISRNRIIQKYEKLLEESKASNNEKMVQSCERILHKIKVNARKYKITGVTKPAIMVYIVLIIF